MKRTLFTCVCGSMEHIFVVTADDEDLLIEVHLSPLPLFERLKHAVQYVFGYRSRWGDFDEIVLNPETALLLGDKLVEWAGAESSVFTPNDVF